MLGFPMLYLRGMRIMMIEFPGFYCKSLGDMDFQGFVSGTSAYGLSLNPKP